MEGTADLKQPEQCEPICIFFAGFLYVHVLCIYAGLILILIATFAVIFSFIYSAPLPDCVYDLICDREPEY